MIQESKIDENLKRLKVAPPPKATTADKIKLLHEALLETANDEAILVCDSCKLESPESESSCPYCDEKSPVEAALAAVEKIEPAEKPAEVPSDSVLFVQTKIGEVVGSSPTTSVFLEEQVTIGGKSQKLVKVPKKKKDEPTVAPTIAVEVANEPSEKVLDQSVARINTLKADMVRCGWELGAELKSIHGQKLYLLRKNPDGSPKYKTWGAFCAQELKITSVYSYTLMEIADAFDRESVATIGISKLRVIIAVPEHFRNELKRLASSGATREELVEAVSQIKEEGVQSVSLPGVRQRVKEKKGKTKPDTKAAASKGSTDRPADTISVVLPRRTRVAMLKRLGKKNEIPAKRVGDEPIGTLDCTNNTRIHFKLVTNTKNELVLVVDVERMT